MASKQKKSRKKSNRRATSSRGAGASRRAASPSKGPVVVRSRAAFERYLEDDRPVIVDFWATWCAPCRAMAPAFERVAQKLEGQVHLLKVDIEQVPELAQAFSIRSIPTLLVLHGTEVTDSRVGLTDEATLHKLARKALDRSQGVGWGDKLKRLFGAGDKASEAQLG